MKKNFTQFSGKKALIVEDYFINQEVTQGILELMGFEVDLAENGREALERHDTHEYDIILMDIQMPEIDGYEATKKIRTREKDAKRTPIIALTANALAGDKEKCLKAGMDDYISKPVEAEKLEDILQRYLPS